jgi:hypothetical protein
MGDASELGAVVIEAIRKRMTEILPPQIRECVGKISDDQIWWRPNDQSNSVGNLILHLTGSLRHYVSHSIGGFQYERDRPAEFAEKGPLPKDELLKLFDQMVEQVDVTLRSLSKERLLDAGTQPSYNPTVFDQLYGASLHMSLHAGQIIYVTKMLEAGSVEELWIKAHSLK